ncbi:hypothetical protein CSKR_203789 [Clonorchis sinensis]|uniref:Uncharacterized protein n=1 Tax=Clonorchis sinensis TaxID=79923 RepID=A0A8T1N1P3_CLOSI|nr:hypothetical protein CSKR_203789 [Clonorchis sinensis]
MNPNYNDTNLLPAYLTLLITAFRTLHSKVRFDPGSCGTRENASMTTQGRKSTKAIMPLKFRAFTSAKLPSDEIQPPRKIWRPTTSSDTP